MKTKKKLSLKKMSIAQLSIIKGGEMLYQFRTVTIDEGGPSEQPVGGGGVCYSDSPTSCVHCV
ncbi:hypothetical protein U6A24_21215 [Aquimarina gracilis]|uniref:Natural product n=1 Tax=Aquimarina gracilis TaxID=874422 RepID=A0ABU6A1G8_9FLAO|nr:hypothetical protein [Aquimarina gracilis]MEB3348009.1 hypothetical protein [Aquimarina gracilis]